MIINVSGSIVKKLLAVASMLGLLVVLAPAAHADDPWVSRAEYGAVKVGHKKAHVHRVFDTRGQLALSGGMHTGESRHYRMRFKGKNRCVAVDYEYKNGAWRVVSKSRPFPPAVSGYWKCR